VGEGKGIITVEDHHVCCGFGSAVCEAAVSVLKGAASRRITILAAPRRFIRHDSRGRQLMEVGVNADRIAQAAKEMLSLAQ
jgi:transketolase C-terminal domain/subunit